MKRRRWKWIYEEMMEVDVEEFVEELEVDMEEEWRTWRSMRKMRKSP